MRKGFAVFVVFAFIVAQGLIAETGTSEVSKGSQETITKDTSTISTQQTPAVTPAPAPAPAAVPAVSQPTPTPTPAVDYYQMLKSPEAAKRRIAVDSIGRMRNPNDIPILIDALNDSDPSVKIVACDALGLMRAQQATDKLISLLNDKDSQVRQSVCVALGYIGDPKAQAGLIERVKTDTDNSVKTQAILILGNMRAASAIDTLVLSLKDLNLDVRLMAAQSLGKIGDSKASPDVKNALTDSVAEMKNEKDQYRLTQYKRLISEIVKASGELKIKESAPDIVKLLNNDDKSIKLAAASSLGKMGNKSGLAVAKNLLNDKDDMVRIQAADTLGNIGDASVIPDLEKVLNSDANTAVKDSVRTALYKLGWKPAAPKPARKKAPVKKSKTAQ